MSNKAWVTLATNDSYGLGALVLANSLKKIGSANPAVVLITPAVTDAMRDRLGAVFAEVITVDVLDSRDATHLALLQRPELGITFTKLHCWSLTQYDKCVFLDADTLIVQNCDELFDREELSAAPDVGWPDCFNSGVFVFKPSGETFDKIVKFAQDRGSFDGGDQGLLNSFFSDWAHGDINKHLPFLYNVTSAAFYSYLPALKHYGQDLKIIHFIGAAKPWLQHFNWDSRSVEAPEHLREFLQLWWDLFIEQVHPQLNTSMTGVAGNFARIIPGSGSFQREALDELSRRQGWEAGNIDYMGADAFDNIWAKISQTLNQSQTSPPTQVEEPSPVKEASAEKQPSPPKETPVEAQAQVVQVIESDVIQSEKAKPEESVPVEVPTPVDTQSDLKSESTPVPVSEPEAVQVASPDTSEPVTEAQSIIVSENVPDAESKPVPAPAPEALPASVLETSPVASEPEAVIVSQTEAVSVVQEETIPVAASESLQDTTTQVSSTSQKVADAPLPPAELQTEKTEDPKLLESLPLSVEEALADIAPAKVQDSAVDEATTKLSANESKAKTEAPDVPPTPPATPKTTPDLETFSEEAPPVVIQVEVAKSAETAAPSSPSPAAPVAVSTDSPPLAHTPAEETPNRAAKCPNRACSVM